MFSSTMKIKLKNNTTYTNTMTKSCKYRVYLDWVYNMYSLIVRQAYDQTIIFNGLWFNHFIYKCHSSLSKLIMYFESALPCTHQLTLSHTPTYSDRYSSWNRTCDKANAFSYNFWIRPSKQNQAISKLEK